MERGITSKNATFSTSFDLAAIHEGYYVRFDYLNKLSYLT